MDKFCVFCGNKPKNKNNEHIIPKWLIEFTGNPSRKVAIGSVWNSKSEDFELKEIAFDQFQFPSCESCNSKYSNLEIKAKDVVLRIASDSALSDDDFGILLDWLDKVRVGLWLASNYLQKNALSIEPNFHIANRMGNSDRLVFIYKSDSSELGVNFGGTDVPAFQYYPICFNLRINKYCFFNMSTDFLISKHLGLPYSKESYYTEGQSVKHILGEGTGRISYPLIRASYDKRCTEIYQPMSLKPKLMNEYKHLYEDGYADSFLRLDEERTCKILTASGNKIVNYSHEPSKNWIPKDSWKLSDLMKMIGKQVLESQIYLINRGPKYTEISLGKKALVKEQLFLAKKINRLIIQALADDLVV